jgi:hypothetical protein
MNSLPRAVKQYGFGQFSVSQDLFNVASRSQCRKSFSVSFWPVERFVELFSRGAPYFGAGR